MDKIEISYHAIKRAKERFDWSDKTLTRIAQKAFDLGFRYKQLKGKVKSYLNNKFLDKGSFDDIRIHGEIVYIFDGQRLVTLYKLPKSIVTQIKRCLIALK